MRNRKNVLVLALLSGLGISAANAEQPDSLKGVKSAVSMQQSTPQQTPPSDDVASTDTSTDRPAPTPTPPPTVSMKPEEMEPLPPPRISSQTVSLSAGDAILQVLVFPNVTTTVTFSDITGAPWALAAEPANSNAAELHELYKPHVSAMRRLNIHLDDMLENEAGKFVMHYACEKAYIVLYGLKQQVEKNNILQGQILALMAQNEYAAKIQSIVSQMNQSVAKQ